jgi:hypothetical protein
MKRNLPEVWEVEWDDTCGSHNWHRSGDAEDTLPDRVTTVGFVVNDRPDALLVTSSTVQLKEEEFSRHSRFDCVLAIPKSAIRKTKRLRKARD